MGSFAMPIYTFRLRDGTDGVVDETGVRLAGEDCAIQYGNDVVRELMKNRELETRSWRLDIYENSDTGICQIPFATVDPTLNHLEPKFRTMVEDVSERRRQLSEAIHSLNTTVTESRALVARSRGKPYLASRFGRVTIR
jgi:hypothetical protein